MNRPPPQFIKNYGSILMAFAVLAIVWFEASFSIRDHPHILGLFLTAMLLSAIAVSVIFQGNVWCRNLCALGAMTGVLAKASILELRMDRNVCISQCGAFDCLQGSDKGEGCPFGLTGPRLESNRICKLCGNCIKNCKHGAININLRPPAAELWNNRNPHFGTALLAMVMLCALISETMLKTPWVKEISQGVGLDYFGTVTAVFLVIAALVQLMAFFAAWLTGLINGESVRENYSAYGVAIIPLAIASFAAFHLYYMLHLGPAVMDLFPHLQGFSQWLVAALTPERIWGAQRIILAAGLIWTLLTLVLISWSGHARRFNSIVAGTPQGILSILLFSLVYSGVYHL
jgi:ferredoxin